MDTGVSREFMRRYAVGPQEQTRTRYLLELCSIIFTFLCRSALFLFFSLHNVRYILPLFPLFLMPNPCKGGFSCPSEGLKLNLNQLTDAMAWNQDL